MQKCSNCPNILSPESKFCSTCGATVTKNIECPGCRRVINSNARFCNFCAFDLTQPNLEFTTAPLLTTQDFSGKKITLERISLGIVGLLFIISTAVGSADYFGLKDQLTKSESKNQEIQKQLNDKSVDLNQKNLEISQKNNEITQKDGEINNKSDEIEKKEKELTRRIGEVKKLQGSVKTVSICLVGVLRGINSLQQNDEYQARQALFEMQSTCEKSKDIINQVGNY